MVLPELMKIVSLVLTERPQLIPARLLGSPAGFVCWINWSLGAVCRRRHGRRRANERERDELLQTYNTFTPTIEERLSCPTDLLNGFSCKRNGYGGTN